MPGIQDVIDVAVQETKQLRTKGKWLEAESILKWLDGEVSSSLESLTITHELIELYRFAMWEENKSTSDVGFKGIRWMLENTTDANLQQKVKECAWIGLRIAEDRMFDNQKAGLLRSGATEELVEGYNPTLRPVAWAKENKALVLKYFAGRKDTDWNEKDNEGFTALLWATKQGNQDLAIMLLVECDVDANIQDKYGRTALSHASESGLPGFIKMVLERSNPDINSACTHTGKTALMFAAEQNHSHCLDLLLGESHIIIDKRDRGGESALKHAAKRGRTKAFDRLLEAGADIHVKDGAGCNMLHDAAERGHDDVISLLLSYGMDIECRNGFWQTALYIATRAGQRSTVALLLENGASED
ncbi:Ankyrin-2 [Dactylellina cionopaga]|nr:Ankyrin-2 [Dactylellina cionopaga]